MIRIQNIGSLGMDEVVVVTTRREGQSPAALRLEGCAQLLTSGLDEEKARRATTCKGRLPSLLEPGYRWMIPGSSRALSSTHQGSQNQKWSRIDGLGAIS